MLDRRKLLGVGVGVAFALAFAGCGGSISRLNTVQQPTGSGAIDFRVQNGTDVAVNNLHMAKTEVVDKALAAKIEPGSPDEAELWGPDLLSGAALERGGRQQIHVPEPGRWDVRAVDRDGRYQHVTGLKLGAGGKYILELGDGGWRTEK
jgi:hypothetical protein